MSDQTKLAERSDVVMCYRLFLRREPESDAAIDQHLHDKPTVWLLMQRFAASNEYEPISIDIGCSGIWRRQDGRDIRGESSAAAYRELLDHIEKIWSAYGTEDPYYSVLTDPAYKADSITPDLKERFYETGRGDLENFKLAFRRNRIDIDPRWCILELGCGLGRIGEHFCSEFKHYHGIDISANHLARAERRFSSKKIRNAKLSLLKDALDSEGSFDIFYSMIVLQHNPPPVMRYLLDVFLSKLRPNGFAFFQLPCHLYGYEFDTDRYLAGQGRHNSMEMHALPQRYVFELLYKHGLRPIEVCPYSAIGPIGISYIFFAQKSPGTAQEHALPL